MMVTVSVESCHIDKDFTKSLLFVRCCMELVVGLEYKKKKRSDLMDRK